LRAFRATVIDEAVGGLAPESKHAAVLCADGVRKLVQAESTNRR
jgi:nitrogen fixation NifU-like protein